MIRIASETFNLSKQTIKNYLDIYLKDNNIADLAPNHKNSNNELTETEKNMRWALNKFFYTEHKNSLKYSYEMLIKSKYTDSLGCLINPYPTFNQFRYFFRKYNKLEKYYIRRNGIKDYQMNHRPLLGEGGQELAPTIGTAMLDSTICDIFLINLEGQLIGRPILTVAVDANTSLCLGYSLLLEGGTFSLLNLMLNIISDKVEICKKMGINIKEEQWNVKELPLIMITDRGTEYKGQNFSQLSELGITIINLPPYRAELKGVVEKFFDVIQNLYKDTLKGKGVIMPNYQQRGAKDYRKEASLTLEEFEKVIVNWARCDKIL